MKKTNQGITLITLVITIIVLLILSGVTIATLAGENGILRKVSSAKLQTDEGEEKEEIAIAYNGARTETKGELVTAEGINQQFEINGTKAVATQTGDKIKVDFETGRSYIIDSYGKIEKYDDISKYLKVGDYVNCPDKSQNKILCKVLYNDENYGVQLVAVNPVDTVTLGYNDETIPSSMESEDNSEKAKYSYNNAIKTLNNKAEIYRNPKYTEEGKARCIGSIPDNPMYESKDFIQSYAYLTTCGVNGVLKDSDDNYDKDWKQLKIIESRGIMDISKSSEYWVCSRYADLGSGASGFVIRNVSSKGILKTTKELCFATMYDKNVLGKSESCGFRPVFSLKSNVKIDSSNGKDGTNEIKAYDLR